LAARRISFYRNTAINGTKIYIKKNIDGHHDDHRLLHFWNATKHTLFRPADDLDGDWVSFNDAAGKHVTPSKDVIQRNEERGAALIGRVVTLANVEPLIDHDKDRNFRDSMIDLEFGRRTD
jgi:hypothetical protein